MCCENYTAGEAYVLRTELKSRSAIFNREYKYKCKEFSPIYFIRKKLIQIPPDKIFGLQHMIYNNIILYTYR